MGTAHPALTPFDWSLSLNVGNAGGTVRHPLLITVPALFLGTPVVTLLSPMLALLGLLVDLVTLRWRLPTVRLMLFSFCYLWLTIGGVIWMGWLWLRTGGVGVRSPASLERHREVQTWWVGGLMGAAKPLLDLEIDIEGLDVLEDGRAVVLSRHASTLDAVVSFVVVGLHAGKKARYILKDDLLWEPALSIAGRRLPNHFVDRKAKDSAAERAAVGDMAEDLDPDEVVVIFPEGTFPNARRRQRALDRLVDEPELLALSRGLTTLLPPRLGGAQELIARSDGADVVFLGHVGFEACSSVLRIWRTIPFSRPVKVRVWRVPAAEVPTDPQDQAVWLFRRWQELDEWVSAELRR